MYTSPLPIPRVRLQLRLDVNAETFLTWANRRLDTHLFFLVVVVVVCACRMSRREGERDTERLACGRGLGGCAARFFGQTVLRSALGARQVALRWNANKLPGSGCRSGQPVSTRLDSSHTRRLPTFLIIFDRPPPGCHPFNLKRFKPPKHFAPVFK